jgi:hypothetical protein
VWHAVVIPQPARVVVGTVGTVAPSRNALLLPLLRGAKGGAFAFIGVGRVVVLPQGREIVAVRGNLLEGQGRVPVALIASAGACVFSDNRCLLATRNEQPAVDVDAGAAIVSANYVERNGATGPSLRMAVPAGTFTVLGNIVKGEIVVNGAALPAASPYRPLNVIVP